MKRVTPCVKLMAALKTQYLVNDAGKKTAVVMDFVAFERFMEKIEDIYLGALAQQALATETEYEDFEKVKKELPYCP